jgi:hypothetical protein
VRWRGLELERSQFAGEGSNWRGRRSLERSRTVEVGFHAFKKGDFQLRGARSSCVSVEQQARCGGGSLAGVWVARW